MNRLYLLRHGLAVPHGTPGYEDDDRPLTPQGERRMRQVARGLGRLRIKLDRIVTSPLPRALRTAEIVAKTLEMKSLLETDESLRSGKSADSIREWLKAREEPRLMIVGHDPAFTDLVGLLTSGQHGPPVCQLRKGGIAAFQIDPDGSYRLDWLAWPGLFRRLL